MEGILWMQLSKYIKQYIQRKYQWYLKTTDYRFHYMILFPQGYSNRLLLCLLAYIAAQENYLPKIIVNCLIIS